MDFFGKSTHYESVKTLWELLIIHDEMKKPHFQILEHIQNREEI